MDNYFVKIGEAEYPTLMITGKVKDTNWDNRESKQITMEADFATVSALFMDGTAWSIVQYGTQSIVATDENGNIVYGEDGTPVIENQTEYRNEYDNSEYSVLGDIVVRPDGTCTVNMGKPTDTETLLELLYGGVE